MTTPTIPGVSPAIAQLRGYVQIRNERQLDIYSHNLIERQRQVPGLLIPTYRLGRPIAYTYILRPDRPRMGDDGKAVKYEWPARVPLCLDILPCFRESLADPSIPIWFTEGAKKTDALASHVEGIIPINLNGVWGWRRKGHDDASHELDDFDEIAWKGRAVVLAFDSDVTLKPEVQQALKALATMLRRRGAHTRVLILPDDGEKVGVDDALAGGMTTDELQSYIREIGDFSPARRSDEVERLEDLDPAEMRRRFLAMVADRDRWKQRAVQLQLELGQVKERNQFVSQAVGANIAGAGKRLTLIELKKEIDTAPGEGRQDGEWTHIRPAHMGACTKQDKGTISNHLKSFESEDWIERKVIKVFDPETEKWTAASFVRPKVDLSDPSQVVLAAKPRGLHACEKCGSMKLKRRSVLRCVCCGHEQAEPEEWANPQPIRDMEDEIVADAAAEAELQFATQDDQPADDPLSCNLPHNKKNSRSSKLQFATQPSDPELQTATQPSRQPSLFHIDVTDPSTLPGVRQGAVAPDDPWIRLQRDLARQALGGISP